MKIMLIASLIVWSLISKASKELRYKVKEPNENNWAYVNWLQTDKVLILPKFEIPEDEQAFRQIEKLIPSYKGRIEMVDARDLVCHEGCFNCCSWTIRE
ncbi:MAG: agmatine deiminase family protein [Bacteroidales bacterium]|jgi:agmatine deiminase|nr:agmatine deiminase family protein [Bacteroidales bacterium]